MINILSLFIFCTLLSAVSVHIAIKLANFCRIADHPGEHKQHSESTPFVGGVGVFAALCVTLIVLVNFYPEHMQKWLVLGFCSIVIFITGFVDDVLQLSYKLRFIIQAFVAFVMVLVGGIVLNDLGGLFFGLPVQLGLFAIPFTVFAIIGGINIINMIDGVDGLSGSLSLVSFLLLSIVAYVVGDLANLFLIAALIGGVAGFLNYNFRFSSRRSAQVFMGDNGTMLLGLLFAWLLIDLAQGPNPAMRPVTAVWLLAIPLMDAISVMHRRIRMGSSPFKPDRNHLHHILLRAGYSVEEVVFTIVSLHLLIGVTGLVGLYIGVPDFVMLLVFFLVYSGYYYLTLRPWHCIPALCFLHTRFSLTPIAGQKTFFGGYSVKESRLMARIISKELRARVDYWVRIYKQPNECCDTEQRYAIALKIRLPSIQNGFDSRVTQYFKLLNNRLKIKHNIQMRQLKERSEDHNLDEFHSEKDFGELKLKDRRKTKYRSLNAQILAFEVTWGSEDLSTEKKEDV